MTRPAWTTDQIDTILAVFDTATLRRARDYASNGMITDIEWIGTTVTGSSEGSAGRRYSCKVTVVGDGPRPRVVASCSCPVAVNCKHCAALMIAATLDSAPVRAYEPTTMELSRWRTLVDEIRTPTTSHRPGAEIATRLQFSDVRTTSATSIQVRILALGQSGRWVTSRLTWRKLLAGSVDENVPCLEGLTTLAGILAASRGNTAGSEQMSLMYAPALVWPVLADLHAAGMEFTFARSYQPDRPVDMDTPITAGLRVRPSGSGVDVDLQLTVDGRDVSMQAARRHLIGRPRAHGLAVDAGDVVHLRPLPPMTPSEAMMLSSGLPLRVDAGDVDDFREALATIAPEREIIVAPDAFPAATVTGPFPVLHVDTSQRTAAWRFGYDADGTLLEYPVNSRGEGRYRRLDLEARLWVGLRRELEAVARIGDRWVEHAAERVQNDLPRWRGDYKRYNRMYAVLRQLQGGSTVQAAFESLPVDYHTIKVRFTEIGLAVLCAEVAPAIAESGGVRVDVVGDAPTFRRIDEAPTLHFSGDATTDWFDLEVSLDVDGHRIPLPKVIAALTLGETHMVTDDGAYFSLDVAELATLRDRLEEAREMGELDGDRASSNSLNATLWDELLELGVVDEQLAAWRERMSGLARATPPEPIEPPAGLHAELRPYQRDGLDWLSFLWDNGLGGVLADDMGLGKTVQTLAVMQRAVDADPDARFLVVAPTSVISNWAAEVRRFVPGLDVVTVTSTQKRAGAPLADRVAGARVVVTSYALLRLDVEAFRAVAWSGAVFDEAQFLKNHNAKTHQAARLLDAPFKLAITGTPMENRVMELWSLVSVVAPGLYPSPLLFKDHFAGPIESGQAPEKLELLRRRLRPIMLRRTKGQVLTDLPEKQEQVLHLELEPAHRKVYDTHLARHRQEMLGLLDDFDGNRIQILRALTRLRQLSLHPGLVDDEHGAVKSAKIEYLAEQLPILLDEGHSALVFSSFTGFLKLVAARLDKAGIAYSYIDGSTPVTRRGEQITEFTSGSTRVFLISLKAGGFGLNLTAADYCFLADPWWNPAAEAQAVDRAHRIGQHRAVTVYRMASVDTIEDKVLELQNRKRELFSALIDEGEAFSGAVSADDVRALFA
ncbi:DNA helicase [Gordonia spumicola]|uniref:DNA helicase n=1 Tax=Gordonia spumicola TaxID=589161 RepID=A0A7I9VEF2_9ACTN|nr:DEAD/DEAH box helicase [Gordonia spumicola]GEE03493.1 DNA helicase [Gordonia spumicola]